MTNAADGQRATSDRKRDALVVTCMAMIAVTVPLAAYAIYLFGRCLVGEGLHLDMPGVIALSISLVALDTLADRLNREGFSSLKINARSEYSKFIVSVELVDDEGNSSSSTTTTATYTGP